MNTVVFEHVKVTELPDAWRKKLSVSADTRVTVRIEDDTTPVDAAAPNTDPRHIADPAFGIWRDHATAADADAHARELRAPRYRRDGTRIDD
jgi:hypothetical protein